MSVSINLIYENVRDFTLKELGSGYMTPQQFNTYSNFCNVELFNKYAKIFQNQQVITDRLRRFIIKEVRIVDANGHMEYPDSVRGGVYDYVDKIAVRAFNPDDLDAAYATCGTDGVIDYNTISQIDVKTIDNDKLGGRLSSSMFKPSRKKPIITFYDSYIQWYPVDIGSGFLEYLRQPHEVLWDYTIGSNGLPVFNPLTSINFEWDWNMRNEIVSAICGYFGISVREQDFVQYANQMKQEQQVNGS